MSLTDCLFVALQNLIDSFLFDRRNADGSGVPRIFPVEDPGTKKQKTSRDGWPYMQYPELVAQEEGEGSPQRGPRFRTWSRAGISLGGVGPST